jgi:hypothetical protein
MHRPFARLLREYRALRNFVAAMRDGGDTMTNLWFFNLINLFDGAVLQ